MVEWNSSRKVLERDIKGRQEEEVEHLVESCRKTEAWRRRWEIEEKEKEG